MKSKPIELPPDVELHPDAWERFERAVDDVMRSPPKHRSGKATQSPRQPSQHAAESAARKFRR